MTEQRSAAFEKMLKSAAACRDWQEQWLELPRQVTPAVIGPDGTVHVGADGLRCLAAIMATAGALPGRERVVQPGPALG